MNFKDYENTLPYPEKKNFQIKYWYKGGKCIAKKGADGFIHFEKDFFQEDLANTVHETVMMETEFKAAKQAYGNEDLRLREKFKNDLFKDLGIENNPKRELLFSKVWSNGHGFGYNQVYHEAVELVDLIL